MRDLIKQKLVDHHANCGVDRYGQKRALDFYSIFQLEGDNVLEYLKENKNILQLCTYGGSLGTYKGINEILDAEIKAECNKAFYINPNRKQAMTSW